MVLKNLGLSLPKNLYFIMKDSLSNKISFEMGETKCSLSIFMKTKINY
jgi:hypothetical protein